MGHMRKNKKVIFIGGSSYSGSTMLDMMLANCSEGFSAGEIHALFNPYRPHHFNPECGCGNPECDFWLQVRAYGKDKVYKSIFELLPNVSYIIDSSKNPWWIKKQVAYLRGQNIQSYHLLIWKEPLMFAHSMNKRGRKGWERAWVNYYRLYLSLIKDYLPVSYKKLALRPDETLEEICRATDIPYKQEQKRYWDKQHHTLFGNYSAKFHLRGLSTDSSANGKNSQYRKIYYDTDSINDLAEETRSQAEKNLYITKIKTVLEKNKKIKDSSYVRYTKLIIILKMYSWILKKYIGRILGRYWRMF